MYVINTNTTINASNLVVSSHLLGGGHLQDGAVNGSDPGLHLSESCQYILCIYRQQQRRRRHWPHLWHPERNSAKILKLVQYREVLCGLSHPPLLMPDTKVLVHLSCTLPWCPTLHQSNKFFIARQPLNEKRTQKSNPEHLTHLYNVLIYKQLSLPVGQDCWEFLTMDKIQLIQNVL